MRPHTAKLVLVLTLIVTCMAVFTAAVGPVAAQPAENTTATPTATTTAAETPSESTTATATNTPGNESNGESDTSTPSDESQTTTETEGNATSGSETESAEYSLSDDVHIVNVDWGHGGHGDVRVQIRSEKQTSVPVTITDAGTVQNLDAHEGTGVRFRTYWIDPGTTNLTFSVAGEDELVTIAGDGGMYASAGDRPGLINVLRGNPKSSLIAWGATGGGIGFAVSAGLVVVWLRRRHETTYKEIMSDERVKVEDPNVSGLIGKAKRFARDHVYLLAVSSGLVAYGTAVAAGHAPSPGDVWLGMSDAGRVVAVCATATVPPAFPISYYIILHVWEARVEFIVDLDARDVLDPSLGSNGGLALDADNAEEVAEWFEKKDDISSVAVYSGAPETVRKMKVDGAPAEIRTPGGKGYIVQEFNPQKNAAVGCWPGTASDEEIIKERSKIDGNREILRDESRMLRTLIGAMPAISTASDTAAMRSVDREIRELANVNLEPIDALLDRAADGTRFSGFYSGEKDTADVIDDDAGESVNEDEEDDEDDEDGLLGGVRP